MSGRRAGDGIETGQVWQSGGRAVRVLGRERARVLVRDSYGWRRSLTEEQLQRGFRRTGSASDDDARGVMACRALPDVEPA